MRRRSVDLHYAHLLPFRDLIDRCSPKTMQEIVVVDLLREQIAKLVDEQRVIREEAAAAAGRSA